MVIYVYIGGRKKLLMIYILILILILVLFNLFKNILIATKNKIVIGKLKYGNNSQNILNFLSIILAIISVFITIDPKFNNWLKETFQNYVVVLVVLFLSVIVLMLYKMNAKDDTIVSLQNDLKSETKELWKNYAQLHQFYKEQNLLALMNIFVTSKSEVISIQRYKYNIYSDSKGLSIRIQGDYSYIREGADLNTVSQGYYIFDLKDIGALRRAYAASKNSLHTENLHDDDYEGLIKLYGILGKELTTEQQRSEDVLESESADLEFETSGYVEPEAAYTTVSPIGDYAEAKTEPKQKTEKDVDIPKINFTDKDVVKYQLLKLINKELEDGLMMNIPMPPFTDKQLSLLNEKRKSGIEIALFLLKNYIGIKEERDIFEYQGNSDSKKNRCYSNVLVESALGEHYVFVISQHLNEEIDKRSQKTKAIENTKAFINLIEEEFYFIK